MTRSKVLYAGQLRTECIHESGATIHTDAPKDNHGKGEAFSPTDLFAVSLASCMLTLMGITARKAGTDLVGVHANVEKMMSVDSPRRIAKIHVQVQGPHSIPEELRQRLEKAALDCPVHHSLHPDIELNIQFHWGQ